MSAIKKKGGVAKLSTTVNKILVCNNAAEGVRLNDGTEFLAPVIISNADLKATVKNLVGEKHFPEGFVQKVRKLTYSCHPVTLKVALKEKVTDEPMIVYIPDAYSPTLRVTDEMKNGKIPKWVAAMGVCPCVIDPSLSPPGKQLIGFLAACPPRQDWKQWEKVMLNNFFRVYPKAEGKVLWHFLETPDLINAYAGEDGNYIGVAQTVNQVHERRPSVVSPLKGLYFSSAEAGGHGIGTELAASSALELFAILASG
jgi:phytoene dehydrogenase-like protein